MLENLGEENLAGDGKKKKLPKVKTPKIGLDCDSLYFISPESRNNTPSLRDASLKAFDYFIEAFHFSLQSYIKHTLFMDKLFAVASDLRLKPTFFDLPFYRVLAGGTPDAFLVFFPLFMVPQCISPPLLLTQQILPRFNPCRQTEKWTWMEASVPALTLAG